MLIDYWHLLFILTDEDLYIYIYIHVYIQITLIYEKLYRRF